METALSVGSFASKKSNFHYIFYRRLCKSVIYNHQFFVYAGFGVTHMWRAL